MLRVLGNRTYARLFAAQVVALLGTGLLTVALGLLAFDIAGDHAGSVLGTALTMKMVAYVGVAPMIAAVVDRLPKKTVLVAADAVRLAIAVALPFVDQAWQIYVLIFILQSASATFTPAFQSLIPAVLPDARDYTRALSLSRLAYDLESLLSPTIAAALLTVISYHHLFGGTAVGFAGSAALVLASRLPAHADAGGGMTFWQRLPLGVTVVARTPTLRFLMLTNVAVAAGTALVLVNSVVYARAVFDRDEAAVAIALAAYGVGSLAMAFVIPRLTERFGVIRTMAGGAVGVVLGLAAAWAVTGVAAASGRGWPALLATWALLGVSTSLMNTPSSRLLADASTPENRNLVYTAQFALSHACFLVTYPIAGWIGARSLSLATAALLALALAATVAAIAYAAATRLRTTSDAPPVREPEPEHEDVVG
ncbi:MFS transporter [Demequina pelophila]|uniref:MFS transporter n=1 Tax=Demequina pelophila TaxID=1638984 RepID=UPI0007861DF6|nr:MFS transporter [Demequina pelophila]